MGCEWTRSCAEEMDRDRGFWWRTGGGPDSCGGGAAIAFTHVDTSAVPIFEIQHQGADPSVAGTTESHSYPFAGGENARVRLGVVDLSPLIKTKNGGDGVRSLSTGTGSGPEDFEVTWMDVDCGPASLGGRGDEDEYLVAVEWSPSPRGDTLLAQVQNRSQTELKLLRLDARTGERIGTDPLLVEKREGAWVNINTMLRVLKMEGDRGGGDGGGADGGGDSGRDGVGLSSSSLNDASPPKAGDFIWVSEKTGYAHLYLHCGDTGKCLRAITSGEDWCVDDINGVDEVLGWVYFTSTKAGPLEKHLYRARLWASCGGGGGGGGGASADIRSRGEGPPDAAAQPTAPGVGARVRR